MSRTRTTVGIATTVWLLATSTAHSQSSTTVTNTTVTTSTTTQQTKTKVSSTSSSVQPHRNGFFKKLLGVAAGMSLGTGANAVRQPIKEEKRSIDDLGGPKPHNPRFEVPFAVFWAPFALATGVLEAPFVAATNALIHSDEPFSKEQLGLKEAEEAPQPSSEDQYHGTTERPK